MSNSEFLMVMVIVFLMFMLVLYVIASAQQIDYVALAKNLSYGKTYLLYAGISSYKFYFMVILLTILICLSCAKLKVSNTRIIKFMYAWILFLWPILIVFGFYLNGYVVGDQPRLEFALGGLLVNGKVNMSYASSLSGYFNWPGLWILEGIFSGITGLDSFRAPVILVLPIFILLGFALQLLARRFINNDLSNKSFTYIGPLLAYTILDPYKLLHLCPQFYALTLFLFIVAIMLKSTNKTWRDDLIIFLMSSAIIVSHPLTAIIVASTAIIYVLKDLTKYVSRMKEWGSSKISISVALSIIILFIAWNINFESLIKSVAIEVLSRGVETSLPPIASSTQLYDIDAFYMFMAIYHYGLIFVIGILTLMSLIKYRWHRTDILVLLASIVLGSLILAMIPGSFFSRMLYFLVPISLPLVLMSIAPIRKYFLHRLLNHEYLKWVFTILLAIGVVLAVHVGILEFLTNNNPVAMITPPFEYATDLFISNYLNVTYPLGVPSGSLNYFAAEIDQKTYSIILIDDIMSRIPTNIIKNTTLVANLYLGLPISVISPRELYIYYMRTLKTNPQPIIYEAVTRADLIYSNGIYFLICSKPCMS